MARNRERGWPADPEPLPRPVPDNHTHLESIGALAPKRSRPTQGLAPPEEQVHTERECRVWPGFATGDVPTSADHLARARGAGVDRFVQVGCDLPSARWTDEVLREAQADDSLRGALLGAVAIHPNEATLHAGVDEVGPDGLTSRPKPHHAVGLDDAIADIAALARGNDRIRAIGETGMDLFRTGPRGAETQRESFRAHVALAKELGLALQIHDRDAHAEVLDVLARDGAPERTVFHCYSGDVEMARFCADQGWYLSFAGPVTFAANTVLRAALAAVPLAQVLVETDAPYLTPHPFRGQPNAPYLLPYTVRTMARVVGGELDAVCARLAATSEAVYGPW